MALLLRTMMERPVWLKYNTTLDSIVVPLSAFHSSAIRLKQRNPISLAEGRLQRKVERREGPTVRLTGTNDVTYKKNLPRVFHSWETGVAYLKSQTYYSTYGDWPVWYHYRRNYKGPWHMIPKARDSCFTKDNHFKLNNPCPLCRDEYLVVHYQNPELLKQFLDRSTGEILDIKKTGLCVYQHNEVRVNVIRAKENGYLEFDVPFRAYDYRDYYPSLEKESDEDAAAQLHVVYVSEKPERYPETRPYPYVKFPEHMPCRIKYDF